jgi:hypothetical protein
MKGAHENLAGIVAAIFFEVKGIIAENEIRVKIFLT